MAITICKTAIDYADKLYSVRHQIQAPAEIVEDLNWFLHSLGFRLEVVAIPELVTCLPLACCTEEDSKSPTRDS